MYFFGNDNYTCMDMTTSVADSGFGGRNKARILFERGRAWDGGVAPSTVDGRKMDIR